MPREQINHPPTPSLRVPIEDPTGPAAFEHVPQTDAAVHIGWHPGSWVQIGLEVDVAYARMAIDSPNGADNSRTLMWTDVLTEDDINRMIATLKRAKRKVFRA